MKRLAASFAMLSLLLGGGVAQAAPVLFTPVPGMTEATGPPPMGPVAVDLSAMVGGRTTSIGTLELSLLKVYPDIPDFCGRIVVVPGAEIVNDDNDPTDDAGHGTHVVEIAARADQPRVSILHPLVRPDDSFNLLFDVEVPDLGTTAHIMHWEALQGLEFESYSVVQPTADTLELTYTFAFVGEPAPIDTALPIVRATMSGDFTVIPEPSSLIVWSLVGLSFVGVARRVIRQRRRVTR